MTLNRDTLVSLTEGEPRVYVGQMTLGKFWQDNWSDVVVWDDFIHRASEPLLLGKFIIGNSTIELVD